MWGKQKQALSEEQERLEELTEALSEKADLLNQKAMQLSSRSMALDRRERDMDRREEKLQTREEEEFLNELARKRNNTPKPTGPLGRDDHDLLDTSCEYCGGGRTMTAYKVFNAETKRVRRRYLCSDTCAYNMDDEQRELVDGLAYVRKSLGVTG